MIIKMEKLIISLVILIISIASINAQEANEFIYDDYQLGSEGKFKKTWFINIDSLINKNYINKRFADSIVNWWPSNTIVDTTTNYRMLVYESGVKLSAAQARDLIQGRYSGYDTILVAFYNLVFANYYEYRKPQYELILRFSNKLDGPMLAKVGNLCFAKLKNSNDFIYGYLQPEYDQVNNTAYLIRDTLSDITYRVDYNTVAKSTQKLAEHYPKVK